MVSGGFAELVGGILGSVFKTFKYNARNSYSICNVGFSLSL